MNSVGIDISKGRSTIAVMRPFGEVVISPFEVRHTGSELSKLAKQLKSLDGETRVVMEATGNYHASVAKLLHDAGLYVSVVNAKLVHDYGNNECQREIRKGFHKQISALVQEARLQLQGSKGAHNLRRSQRTYWRHAEI